jgi:pimeloyl-ACP methyl ester carboxylesterase
VLADSLGFGVPRPFARVEVRHVGAGPSGSWPALDADVYVPNQPGAPIVLVPGAEPEGIDDPRLVRVAEAFARAGRLVVVPQLELRHQVFVWSDVRRIERVALALRPADGGSKVGLVGFSYGGSFALLAAEQPALAPALAFVAVFGSYGDLAAVVQGVTTGATTFGGRIVPWFAAPEAEGILTRAAIALSPPSDRVALAHALAGHDPSGLSPDARSVYDLLTDTDARRTRALVARLPGALRAALRRYSPLAGISRLRARLFILQALHDPATPPTEALRLHAAVPGSRLEMLRTFQHVEPGGAGSSPWGRVTDGFGAWEFVSWILAAQE